jgi:hypothetical protein
MNEEVIYSYTRKDAVEDGQQVLLEGKLADLAKQAGWKYPVYLTDTVWRLVGMASKSETYQHDLEGVLWDILTMARHGRPYTRDIQAYEVIINSIGRRRKHAFYIQIGSTDINDPSPALTIYTHADF